MYRRFSSSASGCVRRRFVATCGRLHHRGLRILVGCRVDHARRVPIDHGRRVDFLFTLFDLFLFFLGVELCSSASRRVPRILVSAVATLKLFDCCVGHFGSVPIDKNHRAVHSITASSSRTCDWFSVLHASRVFRTPEVPENFNFSGSFLPSSHGLSWLIKWVPFQKYWPSWLSVLACCGVSW